MIIETDLDIKKARHIEYTFIDGEPYRVCRPFFPDQIFLIKITSLKTEYMEDMKHIEAVKSGEINPLTGPYAYEGWGPDEIRDNEFINDTAMHGHQPDMAV